MFGKEMEMWVRRQGDTIQALYKKKGECIKWNRGYMKRSTEMLSILK
jgi:hypothetical protein